MFAGVGVNVVHEETDWVTMSVDYSGDVRRPAWLTGSGRDGAETGWGGRGYARNGCINGPNIKA